MVVDGSSDVDVVVDSSSTVVVVDSSAVDVVVVRRTVVGGAVGMTGMGTVVAGAGVLVVDPAGCGAGRTSR